MFMVRTRFYPLSNPKLTESYLGYSQASGFKHPYRKIHEINGTQDLLRLSLIFRHWSDFHKTPGFSPLLIRE